MPLPWSPLLPTWLEAVVAAAMPSTFTPALSSPFTFPPLPLLAATAAAVTGAYALFTAVRLVAAWRTLAVWPSPPTTSWLWGHGAALATPAHHLVLAAWAASCGRRHAGPGVYTLRVAWKRAVVVTDPAFAAAILDARPAKTGLDKGHLYSRFNSLNPDSARGTIFTSPSDAHWAAVRGGVTRCFTPKAVKARYEALAGPPAAAAAWLAALAAEAGRGKAGGGGRAAPTSTAGLFDADDLMMRAALDAVAGACFGLTCGAVPTPGCPPAPAIFETMRACQDWLNTTAMAPWVGVVGYFSGTARAGRAAMAAKKAYALELAATLQRGGGDGDPTSASTALLGVTDPETGRPLSLPRLAGEAVTLLEAGFETTGHTAAYTLALLARNPEAQAMAFAELEAAGLAWGGGGSGGGGSSGGGGGGGTKTPGRSLTAADLTALPYLSACIKEAMRLFPVVGDGPVRTAARTVTLRGAGESTLTIPAGTLVLVPFFAAGRDARAWGEDANAFRPERWLLGSEEAEAEANSAPPPRLYAPFSRGTRNCVGAALGQAMALTLVASVLARVELAWPGGGVDGGGGGKHGPPPLEESLEIRLTLQPKAKLMLVATARGRGGEGDGIKAVK